MFASIKTCWPSRGGRSTIQIEQLWPSKRITESCSSNGGQRVAVSNRVPALPVYCLRLPDRSGTISCQPGQMTPRAEKT